MNNKECAECMDTACTKKYCIFKRLRLAQNGNVKDGIIFTSNNYYEISHLLNSLYSKGKISSLNFDSKEKLPSAKDVLELLIEDYYSKYNFR